MGQEKCVICGLGHTHPGITLNDEGKCSICSGNHMMDALKVNRNSVKRYLEFQMGKGRKGEKWDCLLMYSGGKDSTYLLHKIMAYKKILAFTFVNPYESKIAMENIEEARRKLHFEHISYAPDFEKFNHIMRDTFLNRAVWEKSSRAAEKTPCTVCTLIMVMSACVMAYQMNIPYVVYGADPKQISGGLEGGVKSAVAYLVESVGREALDDFFGEEMIQRFLDLDEEALPMLIYPFVLEEKYEPEKMMELLQNLGLYKGTPETTHCSMYPMLNYYAYKKYGCNFYAHEMAASVRARELTREQFLKIDSDYKKIFLEILAKEEVTDSEKEWIIKALKERYRIFAKAPNRKDNEQKINQLAAYEYNLILQTYEVARNLGITLDVEF